MAGTDLGETREVWSATIPTVLAAPRAVHRSRVPDGARPQAVALVQVARHVLARLPGSHGGRALQRDLPRLLGEGPAGDLQLPMWPMSGSFDDARSWRWTDGSSRVRVVLYSRGCTAVKPYCFRCENDIRDLLLLICSLLQPGSSRNSSGANMLHRCMEVMGGLLQSRFSATTCNFSATPLTVQTQWPSLRGRRRSCSSSVTGWMENQQTWTRSRMPPSASSRRTSTPR